MDVKLPVYMNPKYNEMYKNSQPIADETDIYIFSDPQWTHEEHPFTVTSLIQIQTVLHFLV